MLEPGDTAPDFTLPDQHGRAVSLAALRGAPVVLFFYPKAFTPGCTTQVCGVRDHADAYRNAGASVLGVPGRGHASVAILRMFYGALVFLAIDLGLVEFLRNGSFGLALILWIAGGLAASMLVAPRVQSPAR